MTSLLEKAVNKVSKLTTGEQDEIARIILDELEDEDACYKKFKNTQTNLSVLADEARDDFNSGKTKPMN
jgi:hypothetical protein